MNKILHLLIIFSFFLLPGRALADTTSPDQAPGANILPVNSNTWVRMLRQHIGIAVKSKAPSGSLGQASVDAIFTARNLGPMDVYMPVRMPLTAVDGQNNSAENLPEIKDVSVTVNKSPVAVRRVLWSKTGQARTPWAEFLVLFAAGKDTVIDVEYTIEGTGAYPYISFRYWLGIGDGWLGEIDRSIVIVSLPYEAANENIIQAANMGGLNTTAFGYFDKQQVYWLFENMKFDHDKNIQVSLVMPGTWQTVLRERDNVTHNPDDVQAWSRLAQIYKDITLLPQGIRTDPGGEELYRLGLEAYRKAMSLTPNNADPYAGYADLLYNHYYWTQAAGIRPDSQEIILALQALQRALVINPSHEKASAVLHGIQDTLPGAVEMQTGEYNYPWLTVTPTIDPGLVTPRPMATISTPGPTLEIETEAPQPTAKATTTSRKPGIGIPLCGGAALLPIFIAGLVWMRRGK